MNEVQYVFAGATPCEDDGGTLIMRGADGRLYPVHGYSPTHGNEQLDGFRLVQACQVEVRGRSRKMFKEIGSK